MELRILNIIFIVAIILAVTSIVLGCVLELHWIGHATTGIISFLLAALIIVFGLMLKGRIRRVKGINIVKVHKRASILLGIFVLETFRYGLWFSSWRYEFKISLPESFHGQLGLTILVLAALQLIPSLIVKSRRKIRIPHMILGYTLSALIIIQLLLGMHMAVEYVTS